MPTLQTFADVEEEERDAARALTLVALPLSRRMAVDGDLYPELSPDGQAVALKRDAEQAELVYSDLHLVDSRGRKLTARLSVSGTTIAIELDASGAVFPITVDSLVITAKLKLTIVSWGEQQ